MAGSLARSVVRVLHAHRLGRATTQKARRPPSHLAPTPEGNAADGRNHGHPAGLDGGDDGQQVGRAAHGVPVGHLLDVRPGAKGLAPSSDDDERHRIVTLGLLEPLEDAGAYVVAQRVQGRLA